MTRVDGIEHCFRIVPELCMQQQEHSSIQRIYGCDLSLSNIKASKYVIMIDGR